MPALDQHNEIELRIDFPAFDVKITADITKMRLVNGYREVVFESFIDSGVVASLTLQSEYSNGTSSDLQIKNASLRFRVADHKARTHFITDTLYAMLGLGGPINLAIPNININLTLNFTLATREISNYLQLRQLEYGLLVIGKSSGVEFEIPPHISGEEMNSIALAYHAIVKHQFEWRLNEITQPTPATEDMFTWFDNLKPVESNESVYKLVFGPSPATRLILGQRISLGEETILIDDAFIENREFVRDELAKKDGHIVPMVIKPLSRTGRYLFSNTPQFSVEMLDEAVRSFASVDELLDKNLARRYHQLASSTVANLTDDEISLITTRPELDEDARFVRDE